MKRSLLLFFIVIGFSAQAQQLSKATIIPVYDFHEKIIKFYPNPAVSIINFEFQKTVDKGYTLQIYNFVGKKVSEIYSPAQKTIVSLNDFFRGVYVFQLRDKSGRIMESGKFQVAK